MQCVYDLSFFAEILDYVTESSYQNKRIIVGHNSCHVRRYPGVRQQRVRALHVDGVQ